jgi:hypothetical protein
VIFFFMKFSSDVLVLGLLDRSQSNRGDLFSGRWREFAQDTKHSGSTTMFDKALQATMPWTQSSCGTATFSARVGGWRFLVI